MYDLHTAIIGRQWIQVRTLNDIERPLSDENVIVTQEYNAANDEATQKDIAVQWASSMLESDGHAVMVAATSK